jgi:2,3,4,5-tetrahydropyridine-2,6-dicarboxylate N-succinyltransferase
MLQPEIERLYDAKPDHYTPEDVGVFAAFIISLNQGRVRAAEPDPSSPTGWRVNEWVKKGILLGFRWAG